MVVFTGVRDGFDNNIAPEGDQTGTALHFEWTTVQTTLSAKFNAKSQPHKAIIKAKIAHALYSNLVLVPRRQEDKNGELLICKYKSF